MEHVKFMAQDEVAALLDVDPPKAREILRRDGVHVIEVSPRTWRVRADEFDAWSRGDVARGYGAELSRMPG